MVWRVAISPTAFQPEELREHISANRLWSRPSLEEEQWLEELSEIDLFAD